MSVMNLIERVADERSSEANDAWTTYKALLATVDHSDADVAELRRCMKVLGLSVETCKAHAAAVRKLVGASTAAAGEVDARREHQAAHDAYHQAVEARKAEDRRQTQLVHDAEGVVIGARQRLDSIARAQTEASRVADEFPFLATDAPTPHTAVGRRQLEDRLTFLDAEIERALARNDDRTALLQTERRKLRGTLQTHV